MILFSIVIVCIVSVSLIGCTITGSPTGESIKTSTKAEVQPKLVSSPSEVNIGVILSNNTDDFEKRLIESMNKESQELGPKVTFAFNESNPDKNVECAQDLIVNKKVNVLIVDSPTKESFDKILDLAWKNGVYLFNTETLKEIDRLDLVIQYVGSDNSEGGYKVGSKTGQLISSEFGGKADLIILDMPQEKVKYKERANSFLLGIQQYAREAKVVLRTNGSESIEEVQKMVEDLLNQYPDVNVIFSVTKESTVGALLAAEKLGKDPANFMITGYDATKEIFESIRDGGFVRAVVVDQPDEIAHRMLIIAIDLMNGNKTLEVEQAQRQWILTALVTKDNVNDWLSKSND